MENILTALVSELRRLKSTGVKTVNLSPTALESLRRAMTQVGSSKRTAPIPRDSGAAAVTDRAERTVEVRVEVQKVAAAAMPEAKPLLVPAGSKSERMAWLTQRVVDDEVCRSRVRPGKKVVVGVGDLNARIFFCGEAPGAEEEVVGEPFVGPAGQLLNRMIQAMGLQRKEVYIGNIMNWRPELPTASGQEQVGNRPPSAEEMSYCLPFFRAQLEIVNPEVIVALGSTAAQGLFGMGSFKALGEIRGQWKLFGEKPVMVTYHPSYILRNASNRSKRAIWEDLLKVMERVGIPISERQRKYFLEAK
ncbi:MAG TPA: uracil-DNA glycosylase [Opitutaceae bacterium]|nr:uracil-DNA glycosylase [Opitutaceae bacterium]